MGWRPAQWWLVAVGLGVAAVLLFAFDPQQTTYFPRCPFHALTGYQCTGCGSQRALHDLSHLRIGEAWGHNPLAVAAIPHLLLGWLAESRAQVSDAWAYFRKTAYGINAIWTALLVIVVFTVGRNL